MLNVLVLVSRRSLLGAVSLASCLAAFTAGSSAHAQMERSKLESLNSSAMSPPHAWNAQRTFTTTTGSTSFHTGTFSNYATAPTATGASNDPRNMAYVSYSAPKGSLVNVGAFFAETIPAPANGADACHHAHLEWASYRFGLMLVNSGNIKIPVPITRLWSSTGALGRRMLNGVQVNDSTQGATCSVTSAPDTIYTSMNLFNWGPMVTQVSLGTEGSTTYTSVAVLIQGASHGWGGCGSALCFPKVGIFGSRVR
jgi:hypothetical protein